VDTATWQEIGPPLKIGVNVYSVTFTPDGKLLAVGCADNLIRICDVATHQEIAALSEHRDYVHSSRSARTGAVWCRGPATGRFASGHAAAEGAARR